MYPTHMALSQAMSSLAAAGGGMGPPPPTKAYVPASAIPKIKEAKSATKKSKTKAVKGEDDIDDEGVLEGDAEGGSSFERRAWTRKEDEAIVRLVQTHGTKRWSVISESLNKEDLGVMRSGKVLIYLTEPVLTVLLFLTELVLTTDISY
jgi:hypothetical protein